MPSFLISLRLITGDTFIAGADNADSYSNHLYPSQVEEASKGIMYDEKQPDRMGSLFVVGYQEVVKFLLSNFGMDLSAELVFLTLENILQSIHQNKEQCVFNSHIHRFFP